MNNWCYWWIMVFAFRHPAKMLYLSQLWMVLLVNYSFCLSPPFNSPSCLILLLLVFHVLFHINLYPTSSEFCCSFTFTWLIFYCSLWKWFIRKFGFFKYTRVYLYLECLHILGDLLCAKFCLHESDFLEFVWPAFVSTFVSVHLLQTFRTCQWTSGGSSQHIWNVYSSNKRLQISCLSGFSIADSFILSSYIFTIPFSLFVHEFTFVEMLPFFYLFFFGFNCIHTPAI